MTPNPSRPSSPDSVPPKKASDLPVALLLALAAGATALPAQTTTTTAAKAPSADAVPTEQPVVLDEFVVAGIRLSLGKALDVKRANVQMVDSIVSEDIGKFPDNNLVEAMQRVTGVQVTNRGSGEVSGVSIRGLSDVTTTVNGRNIFTASGRSVALADIPASLLAQVDVFKTRSASQIETGIAGQIDIHTHRPFDFKGRKAVLAARGIYQEQADKFGPNLSMLYSDTWTTNAGKFGALVNLSYAKTEYRDQSVTAGAMVPFVTGTPPAGWTPYERIFPTDGRVAENPIWQAGLVAGLPFNSGATLKMNGVAVPYVLSRDAIFSSDFTGKRERPAANLALQFAPNDTSEYTFEAFYNGYRNEAYNDLLFSFVDWWGALGTNPSANITLYPGTNIVKARKNVGFPYGFTSGDLTTGKTDSYIFALGGKWDISPDFKLRSDATYQTSEYNETFFAMRADRVLESISVDFNSHDGLPAFSFGDNAATAIKENDLTDASQWNIAQLYDNANRRKGDAGTVTLDGDFKPDWGFITKISFGGRYDSRGATEAQRTQDAAGLGQKLSAYPELIHVNSGFFDGKSDVPTTWAAVDAYALRDNADKFRSLYKSTVSPNLKLGKDLSLFETFEVEEGTAAGYLQADFKTFVGKRKLDGQFGARYVSVDTDMTFNDINTLKRSTASARASKLLPSAMVRYELTDSLRLRLSYGQTLRRPAFNQLNPNINYVQDVTNIGYGTASGGNPNLKPTESKNYDAAVEWYFAETSAIYVSAFKRKIDGFVVDFRRRVTYNNYDYILTQPDNASNGELSGFEYGLVYFPKNLPPLLQGLGVQASYTMLDSEQDIPITDSTGKVVGKSTTPLFGVSDSSYSVVLAYEKKKFGARLSYVWREAFLANYEAALFANPLGVYRRPEASLDFQFNYNVSKNFAVTFDVTNITEEIYQSYYQYPETHNFGSSLYSRTFAVGGRYTF